MSTIIYKVYNSHSWFTNRYDILHKELDSYSTDVQGTMLPDIPTDDNDTPLGAVNDTSLIMSIKDGQVTGLKFNNWRKNRCSNHHKHDKELTAEFINGKMVPNDVFLEFLFGFTGIGPDVLIMDSLTPKLFYNYIYNIEFTTPIVGIFINTCGCNMGHCSAVMGYEKTGTFNNIKELFEWVGQEPVYEEFKDYYEYPDSVMLQLKHIDSLPKLTTDKWHSSKLNFKPDFELNDSDCYFTASFGR